MAMMKRVAARHRRSRHETVAVIVAMSAAVGSPTFLHEWANKIGSELAQSKPVQCANEGATVR
jgi:hypothetical protein